MNEQECHDAILQWCRSKPRGYGLPCMRTNAGTYSEDGKFIRNATRFVIVDNSRFSSPVLFEGSSWTAIFEQFREKGLV